ncbi:MAG TPA: glycosyltransferase [Polyangia bacterium]|nr:glycosyltransferase [Polyangia bacterium]
MGIEWYTRFFDCPESYADPIKQYEICKARGMSLVTLTDHDTIEGGLKLMDRPDFFLSEEITTTFPDSGCVVHVLAWNITPAQHEAIQERRSDIFRLVEYLNSAGIAHGLAHPLMGPNWKLDAQVIEKLLVLFPTMESINGLTDARIEPDLPALLMGLTGPRLDALAQKHNLLANGSTPHKKAFTGGSDDHVHRRCATVYTEVDGALSPKMFLDRCLAGQARVVGEQAHLDAMALTVHHTTYHHLNERRVDRPDYRDPFVEMMDVIAGREQRDDGQADGPGRHPAAGFLASLVSGARRASLTVGKELDILEVPVGQADEDDARLIGSIARLGDTVVENALDELMAGAHDFDLYRIFAAVRDLAGGLVTAAPVFAAADHFGKQEQQVRRIWEQWTAWPLPPRPERLAVFSDSLEQVDGVSTWCKRFVGQARAAGRDVLMPYCGELPAHIENNGSFHVLPSSTSFRLPLYARIRFYVPSLIDTLRWVWSQRISHVELSTPGPMGLVGLLVAKVLRLPVTASYHTEVPALVEPLGGNALIARAAKRYLSWFYGRVDRVFAFSSGSRDALIAMGVAPDKLSVMPVAVDPEDFSPAYRSNAVFEVLNLDVGGRPVVLSVGRISEEKNLPMVVEAVERLQGRALPPLLLIAGDGPERGALEALWRDKDFVRFVGLQNGETLKRLYASARMFVFASRVDTLGLVNMEAMSSGLPVLVPSDACFAELVKHDVSAECYKFGPEGLAAGIARILDDPTRAERLATNGRRAMIDRWNEAPFSRIWKSFTQQV